MMSGTVVKGPPGGRILRTGAGLGSLAVHFAGIAALTLVLVSSGAFDSDDLPLGGQMLMFAVVSTLLVVQSSALAEAVRRVRGSSFAMAGAVAAAMLAALLLMTIEIHALKFTPVVPYAPDPLPDFALFLMPFVVPVSAFVLGLKWMMAGRAAPASGRGRPFVEPRRRADRPDLSGLAPPPPAPIRDWPPEPVRRVQAVDHYLHLWTGHGLVLVRGRMRDALRRLSPSTGIQAHRSWWVARSEIDRLERRGRDHVLRLRGGDRVPVARSRVPAVRRFLGGQGRSDP